MTLLEALRQRTLHRGQTAQVPCGALGTVTVEALSPQECAALGMADGGRALFYAACRELQLAGETLRREQRLFTPDEITHYLSPGEARTAALAVLALSGVTPGQEEAAPASSPEAAAIPQGAPAGEDGADADKAAPMTAAPGSAAKETAQEGAAEELPDTVLPQSGPAAPAARAREEEKGSAARTGETADGKPANVPAPEKASGNATNGGFSTAFTASAPKRPFMPAETAFRKTAGAYSADGNDLAAQTDAPVSAARPASPLSAPAAAEEFPEAAAVERETGGTALPEDTACVLPMARSTEPEAPTAAPLAAPFTPENILQAARPSAVDTAALAQQMAQALLEGLRRAAAVR